MIVNSKIKLISNQGDRSYVVEEYTSDDGRIFRVEGLRENGDFEQQIQDRVSEVEAILEKELLGKQEIKNIDSGQTKITAFLKTKDLKQEVGLTDDEVAVIKL